MDLKFGHMIIKKDGEKCTCGNNGCFERYASMKTLKENIKLKMNLEESIEGEKLYKIVNDNKASLEDVIDEFIENLSIGIVNIINIFEPEAICIGGSFVHYKDLLLDRLIKKLDENIRPFNKEIPEIFIAKMRK